MKKTILVATALAALSFSAFAADLPARTYAPVAPVATNWSGFYAGVQLGGARLTDTHNDLNYWYYDYQNYNIARSNVLFGLKAGYDFKFSNVIVGALVEGSLGNGKASKEVVPSSPSYIIGSTYSLLASARGKLGMQFSQISVFTTGGIAFSNLKHKYTETDGSGEYYSGSGSNFGYVVGLGAAYDLSAKWAISVDLSRYVFGPQSHDLLDSSGTSTGSRFSQRNKVDTLMGGLNYKF